MTSDDVSSLSEKSFELMRSVFLGMSDSVTQSNGPLRHWTCTILAPLFLLCTHMRPIPPPDLPAAPRLSYYLARKQHDTGLLSWRLFLSNWHLVQSTSGLTIQHSQSWPSLCLQQQSCSARREWSDGQQTEQYGCVLFFMHAFWMALSTFILALFSGYGSLALSYSAFLYFLFGLFSSFCFLFHRLTLAFLLFCS